MDEKQIELAAAYVRELNDAGHDHVEMFRLCAERFPEMKKSDFVLAVQIALLDSVE